MTVELLNFLVVFVKFSAANIVLNGLCLVEGHVEEAIRGAFLKLDEDMTLGLYYYIDCSLTYSTEIFFEGHSETNANTSTTRTRTNCLLL